MRSTKKLNFHESYVPEPNSGCWLWERSTAGKGYNQYGRISYNKRVQRAHRVSWQIHNGPIPVGMLVCHKCDTPLCVNPDHLFLGTHKENMRDMVNKGRSITGEKHYHAKLTLGQVKEIRKLRQSGVATKQLSQKYGVGDDAIIRCFNGQCWGLGKIDVPDLRVKNLPRGEKHHNSKLTDEQRVAIARDTRSSSIIAKEYGIHFATVCKIRKKAKLSELETVE